MIGLNFIANCTTSSDVDTIGAVGTYYYAIIAASQLGNSSLSNCVSVTIFVSNVSLSTILPSPNYNGSIALSWTTSPGATGYYVFRNITPIVSVTGLNFIANPIINSFNDIVGAIGTYYYAVVATNQTRQ